MNNLRVLKKGITLLELVVSIAVSSVIFVGVTGLLIFVNSTNDNMKTDIKNFYNANTLSHAIVDVLDEGNSSLSSLPSGKVTYDDETADEVADVIDDTPKLFSVSKDDIVYHYYFYKQHFGYTTETASGGLSPLFNNIYASATRVKIEIDPQSGGNYVFSFYYGQDYSGYFSFTKFLVMKG